MGRLPCRIPRTRFSAVYREVIFSFVFRCFYKKESSGGKKASNSTSKLAKNSPPAFLMPQMKKIKLMESNLNIQQKLLEQRANININGSKVNDVLSTARTNVAV